MTVGTAARVFRSIAVFGVATALQRHPDVTAAFRELGHEIACHGLKWIHYQHIDEATWTPQYHPLKKA